MKKSTILDAALVGITLLTLASAAYSQVPIRPITPEEEAAARGAQIFRERTAFLANLFAHGAGVPADKCRWFIVDPAQGEDRFNYALKCKGKLTWDDVVGPHETVTP